MPAGNTLDRLLLRIEADTSMLRAELEKSDQTVAQHKQDMERETAGVGEAFDRMGARIVAAAGAYLSVQSIVNVLGDSVRAAMEAEQAHARVAAILEATGSAAGVTEAQVERLSQRMAQLTLFDDEEVTNAASALLLFGEVGAREFDRVMMAAADLSALLGGDLQSNVLTIGRAMEDPAKGLAGLNRQLRLFTGEEMKAIEAMVEQGDQAQALEVILERLESRIAGTAQALQTGLTGAASDAGDAWNTFLETLGTTGPVADTVTFALDQVASSLRGLTALMGGDEAVLSLDQQIVALNRQLVEAEDYLAQLRESGDGQEGSGISAAIAAQEGKVLALKAQVDELIERARAEAAGLDNAPASGTMGDGGNLKLPATGKRKLPPGANPDLLDLRNARAANIDAVGAEVAKQAEAYRKILDKIDQDLDEALDRQEAMVIRAADAQKAALKKAWEESGGDAREYANAVDEINRATLAKLIDLDNQRTENARRQKEERERLAREEAEEVRQIVAGSIAEVRDQVMSGSFDIGRIVQAILGDLAGKMFEDATNSLFHGADATGSGGFNIGSLVTDALAGLGKLLPGFAAGGNPPVGMPALVGEKGPEIFVPRIPGTIVPNEALRTAGGGAGTTVNVYQTNNFAPGVTPSDLAAGLVAVKREAMAGVIEGQRRTGGRMI